jgi:hypothetical protein
VETGVQAVPKGLKILDSGFCRNDGQKGEWDFFTASEDKGGFVLGGLRKSPPTPLAKGGIIFWEKQLTLHL